MSAEPDEALSRAFLAMKVAAALREATWGMISELFLNAPGVDYVAYAAEYLGRFEAILQTYEQQVWKIMSVNLPQAAEVIVIGGGIIGCSTAYHLARDHKANVILLEQNKITSGSTWHAAGLVGQLRSSASITQVLKYSVDLYKSLEAETGLANRLEDDGLPAPCHQCKTAGLNSSASPPRRKALAWRCSCSRPLKPRSSGRCWM